MDLNSFNKIFNMKTDLENGLYQITATSVEMNLMDKIWSESIP